MIDSTTVLALASDHGGFEMKEFLKTKLDAAGYKYKDFGTYTDDSVDYPDYIHPLAKAVNDGEYKIGIIMCGSGNGAQMTANKYPNVRAGLCWNEEQARLTRLHNNANILVLGGRVIGEELAMEIVNAWLKTPFDEGRHKRRICKFERIEDMERFIADS